MFPPPRTAPYWQRILAPMCGMVILLTASLTQAQPPVPDREPAPPRQRAGGEQRSGEETRTNNQRQPAGRNRGTPDGQPEVQIAPAPEGRIDRPRIAPNQWHLGVYAYNTSRGVMITDVVPNSPAARAGLEPRDLIVTVEGFQVGYVHDTLYSLGNELQNRADRRGNIHFLVQNWRNNELTNLDVRLERHGTYYRRER